MQARAKMQRWCACNVNNIKQRNERNKKLFVKKNKHTTTRLNRNLHWNRTHKILSALLASSLHSSCCVSLIGVFCFLFYLFWMYYCWSFFSFCFRIFCFRFDILFFLIYWLFLRLLIYLCVYIIHLLFSIFFLPLLLNNNEKKSIFMSFVRWSSDLRLMHWLDIQTHMCWSIKWNSVILRDNRCVCM